MAHAEALGLFWEDQPTVRGAANRTLGPMPEIPETGWRPPTEMPNIRHAKWQSIDTETYDPELQTRGAGWARGVGHIVGISVAAEGAKWYFPMRHEIQKELNLDPDMVLRWATWAFGNENCVKIGANLQYDIGWLRQEGVRVPGQLYDCQHAEALISETSRLNLETLGQKYVGRGKDSDLLKKWCQLYYGTTDQTWRRDIYRTPVTLAGPYAEEDAVLPQEVLMKQWPLMQRRNLLDLYHMECDMINLLVEMRFAGVTIDLPYAEQLYDEYGERAAIAQKAINRMAGFEVNTNAGDSLARAFNHLGLKYGHTAPTEGNPNGRPSFTAPFMKTVNHDFARGVLEVKGLEKIRSTFIKSYLIDAHVNSKVYTTFHSMATDEGGARTGRFSSSDPNLQNIPIRTEDGAKIRRAFIMDDGHKQVRDYDLSQIEYRMLAHFAVGEGGAAVRKRYWDDPTLDYHKMIGEIIFEMTGIRLERVFVKTANFGLVYGLGKAALADQLGVPLKESIALLKTFHTAVPFARETMDAISKEVQRTGIVETILGRQSHFDLWEKAGYGEKDEGFPLPYRAAFAKWGHDIMRAYTYRAVNYKLQGSAADHMKKGMVKAWKDGVYAATGVPRLTVHDELLFSERHDTPDDAWAAVKDCMENCLPQIKVPIRADFGVGPSWKDAH